MSNLERLERELADLRALPTPRIAPITEAFARIASETEALREAMTRPEINIEVKPATVLQAPATDVRVDVPDQSAAIVALTNILDLLVSVLAQKEMSVTVNVPEQAVQVSLVDDTVPAVFSVTFERNRNGTIKSATITEET